VVIHVTAVVELDAGIHRGCFVLERSREMPTAIHVLHGFGRGLFVLAGVVGNASILKSGGGHGGIQKKGALSR
jgi:hypothetical protein